MRIYLDDTPDLSNDDLDNEIYMLSFDFSSPLFKKIYISILLPNYVQRSTKRRLEALKISVHSGIRQRHCLFA